MGKERKLIITVKEFDRIAAQRDYNINGINNEIAQYFYRVPQGQFLELAKGDYTVLTVANNQILRITNDDTLAEAERFQIGYEFEFTASDYKPEFGVDPNVLKDRYNELFEDVQELFAYIKENMMVADGQDVNTILPQLNTNEVWVKTDTGFRGFDIGDLEANIAKQIKEFQELVTNSVNDFNFIKDQGVSEVNQAKTDGVKAVQDQGDFQNDRLNSKTSELDTKLDLMWKMYSIITGANRYLSGNNLESRSEQLLEREVVGGDIATRTGTPRRVYNGGNIADRELELPIVVDLGSYQGGQ